MMQGVGDSPTHSYSLWLSDSSITNVSPNLEGKVVWGTYAELIFKKKNKKTGSLPCPFKVGNRTWRTVISASLSLFGMEAHACLPHSRSALPIIVKASFSLFVIPYIHQWDKTILYINSVIQTTSNVNNIEMNAQMFQYRSFGSYVSMCSQNFENKSWTFPFNLKT